jgi:hypothetical protein
MAWVVEGRILLQALEVVVVDHPCLASAEEAVHLPCSALEGVAEGQSLLRGEEEWDEHSVEAMVVAHYFDSAAEAVGEEHKLNSALASWEAMEVVDQSLYLAEGVVPDPEMESLGELMIYDHL